jgi:rsbT co-antagonist protein RsbR
MGTSIISNTNEKLLQSRDNIIRRWIELINLKVMLKKNIFNENEIKGLCEKVMDAFIGLTGLDTEINFNTAESKLIHKNLTEYSKITAGKGLTQVEVSSIIFSLKNVIFDVINNIDNEDSAIINKELIRMSDILDKMGLFTFDIYVKEREEIIIHQQQDMIELSTPVIQVWDKILAIPLIGTLDSKRTQLIMEKLLEMIVSTSSLVAIIDITGIPMVDTLVANHLLKTASATRLLGAELIITGISPMIAQTMVHLGVDLSGITTRALMADGIKLAMELADYKVIKVLK